MSKKKHKRQWKTTIGRQKPVVRITPRPGHEPTTEKLARALEEAGAPATMIAKARAGYYDDFKSNVADNMNRLIQDASNNQLPDITMRAIEGEFESQNWEARDWMEHSAEGQSIAREFGL